MPADQTARLAAALAGRYRIDRELGAGGMATVFLAHDLKHDRQVALKVLRPELAAVLGAERFLREITTTANLHHPHILALYDSGDADGLLFYVMPFVEGESLRQRLDRETQLPLADAVRIAREVADALGYAHTRGLIHRDIKPENILLEGGHALVADFGIALAIQTAGGERITRSGISIGTPQYMSPEQAAAERRIDARADIYALGAVTYEMLTGEPPFQGPTAQAIIAKAMAERPTPPSTVRDTVPPLVDAVVARALAKLPADRYATAQAFAEALAAAEHAAPAAPGTHAGTGRARRRLAWAGAAAIGLGVFFLGRALGGGGGSPVGRFGQATQVTWEPGLEISPAISPDGKLVAYAAGNGTRFRIFVRPVTGGRAVPLTDDTGAVETQPEWSRDGSRILFIRNGQVFSAPAGGGAPRQEVPPRGGSVETATWSPDARAIAYGIGDSLFLRDAAGASRPLAGVYLVNSCSWGPRHLIACTAGNHWYLEPGMAFGNVAPSEIVVVNADDGRVTAVTENASSNIAPRWTADGRSILYVSNRLGPPDIYAVRVGGDGSPRGEPRRLTVGLGVHTFSLSADGSRIAYAVMRTGSNVWSEPWPVRPDAPETQVTYGEQTIEGFAVSKDGRWLYYDSDLSGNPDIYRLALPAGNPERLTTTRTPEFDPSPSPDGRAVAFHAWRTGSRDIFVMPLDGGPVVQVTHSPEQEQHASWSPDGTALAFAAQSEPYGVFVARRSADGTWTTRKVAAVGHWPAWSPDGKSVSYSTQLLGGGLRVVAADGGTPRAVYDERAPGAPRAEVSEWTGDGRTIYFKAHDGNGDGWIWSVPAAGGTPRRIARLGDERLRSDRYGFRITGGRVYYTLFDRQSDVWVMELAR